MKILFLVYSRQPSVKHLAETRRTGFSWVDTLLDEFDNHPEISVGLALPVKEEIYSSLKEGNLVYYGLPEKEQSGRIPRFLNRIKYKVEESNILLSVQKAIEDFNPDIVHIFGTENPLGEAVIFANKPTVIHFQGSLNIVARKWFAGVPKMEMLLFGSLLNIVSFRGPYHEFFFFRKKVFREMRTIQNCKYFIGRTKFDRQLLSLLAPNSKYFHCEEFIRPQFFLKEWEQKFGKQVNLISVLKGVTYKGLDILFETSAILDNLTSTNFVFTVCGIEAEEEFVKILKKKYKNETDTSKFIFLGKIDTDTLVIELLKSDVFVHPSYIENSANSICEAMALGMPVVATNVGGTSSILNDGVEGCLVQEGDPLSMAAAIRNMVDNSDHAKYLGHNARIRALARHKPETIYSRLNEIYNEILRISDLSGSDIV